MNLFRNSIIQKESLFFKGGKIDLLFIFYEGGYLINFISLT